MKFSIKDFFSKCDHIRMRIWSHLPNKSLMQNFIFFAVKVLPLSLSFIYLGHIQIKTLNTLHCDILNVAHDAFFRK